jgi:outer membrane lipoprotein-sorting protein
LCCQINFSDLLAVMIDNRVSFITHGAKAMCSKLDRHGFMNQAKLAKFKVWRPLQAGPSMKLDGVFHVVMHVQTAYFLFFYLLALVPCAVAQTESAVPTVETITARMAQARTENRAHFRPYRVTREYKLFGKERVTTKSEVIADITFVTPDLKKYVIQHTDGNVMGEKIVHRVLDGEVGVAKDSSSTDISRDNYDVHFIREEEVSARRCYVLELLPRRNDKNLLRGEVWVDANTYLLQRVEGQPAKSSSWWVRDMRIVLLYSDVDGMWLQTALEATANVRILGPSAIVSSDMKYEFSDLVATEPSALQEPSVEGTSLKGKR